MLAERETKKEVLESQWYSSIRRALSYTYIFLSFTHFFIGMKEFCKKLHTSLFNFPLLLFSLLPLSLLPYFIATYFWDFFSAFLPFFIATLLRGTSLYVYNSQLVPFFASSERTKQSLCFHPLIDSFSSADCQKFGVIWDTADI